MVCDKLATCKPKSICIWIICETGLGSVKFPKFYFVRNFGHGNISHLPLKTFIVICHRICTGENRKVNRSKLQLSEVHNYPFLDDVDGLETPRAADSSGAEQLETEQMETHETRRQPVAELEAALEYISSMPGNDEKSL